MKNMKNIFYTAALILCVTALFASCSDDDYDVKGYTYNRVYLVNDATSYEIIQTSVGTVGSIEYETFVKCTNPASGDISVSVAIDNSMIEEYNSTNGTAYEAMPDGAVTLENASLTIPKGEMSSDNTLRVSLTGNTSTLASLTSENGYLVPLRITGVNGGKAHLSSDVYYSCLFATVTFDDINHDASQSDITGTLVEDQSGWTATTTGSVSTSSRYSQLDAIFDGDETTYAYITYSSGTSCDLVVDMGKQYSFDGLYMAYGSSSIFGGTTISNSFASGMPICISDDGNNWTDVGETTSSSTYVAFYGALTARYVKITKTTSSYWYVGVFNVYAK